MIHQVRLNGGKKLDEICILVSGKENPCGFNFQLLLTKNGNAHPRIWRVMPAMGKK